MSRTGIVTLLILGVSVCLIAADTPIDRESLRDLDGVRVVVEEPPAVLKTSGLSKDDLQKSIESKLRTSKINVLNSGEFPVGDPFLHLRVTTTAENGGLIAYEVELDFRQTVFMRRNPAVTFNRAQTWKADEHMGLVRATRLGEAIQSALSEALNQFVTAFFLVNPK
jgi:hypothetical protein